MVTAFTCACLPIYKPLWTSISLATSNLINRYANSLRSLIRSDDNNNSKSDTYLRMDAVGNSGSASMHSHERDLERCAGQCPRKLTTVTVTGGNESDQEPLYVPQGSIGYFREVNVV
jgi:hypothetical protein